MQSERWDEEVEMLLDTDTSHILLIYPFSSVLFVLIIALGLVQFYCHQSNNLVLLQLNRVNGSEIIVNDVSPCP